MALQYMAMHILLMNKLPAKDSLINNGSSAKGENIILSVVLIQAHLALQQQFILNMLAALSVMRII